MYFIDFEFDVEVGELQSKLGTDAYLTETMKMNEFETFNPILNIGGLFIMMIYACCVHILYPFVKCCHKF